MSRMSRQEQVNNVVQYIKTKSAEGIKSVVLPKDVISKLVSTTSVQTHQMIRYEVGASPNVVMELSDDERYRNKTRKKVPYAFRVLSDEEMATYKPSSRNFRFLTDEQVSYIDGRLSDITDNKSVFTMMMMTDLFLVKNPKNVWGVVEMRLFTTHLVISIEVVEFFIKTLCEHKIWAKAEYKGKVFYKATLSEKSSDLAISEASEQSFAPEGFEVEPYNPYKKRKVRLLKEKMERESKDGPIDTGIKSDIIGLSTGRMGTGIIQTATPDNTTKQKAETPEEVLTISSDSSSATEALQLFLKEYTIERNNMTAMQKELNDLKDTLVELEGQLKQVDFEKNSLQKDMDKSHKAFQMLNDEYSKNQDELLKARILVKECNEKSKAMKEIKAELSSRIKKIMDVLCSKIMTELTNYTAGPNTPTDKAEFQTKVMAITMDAITGASNAVSSIAK